MHVLTGTLFLSSDQNSTRTVVSTLRGSVTLAQRDRKVPELLNDRDDDAPHKTPATVHASPPHRHGSLASGDSFTPLPSPPLHSTPFHFTPLSLQVCVCVCKPSSNSSRRKFLLKG
ncbi:hypothetical protein E2C01_084905 [Portunus trituberculatus]|uniref:Uncharacterized protein n=1 Tax=Portunus trituberculatus TaxID=210409 RepID=A0A5B7IWK4_PORTR|nr:hypothetical protein [Portunus trituberculatus]